MSRIANTGNYDVFGGAVGLATEQTSDEINVIGFSQLTAQANYTHDSATEFRLRVEATLDGENWGLVRLWDTSSDFPRIKLVGAEFFESVSGDTVIPFNLPINSLYVRFKCSTLGGTVDDTVQLLARFGAL